MLNLHDPLRGTAGFRPARVSERVSTHSKERTAVEMGTEHVSKIFIVADSHI